MRIPKLAAATAALLVSLAGAANASADVLHTAPNSTRAATPCTAVKPCALPYALGQAFDGDEVVLAPGTYDHHRADPLEVRPGVVVRGVSGRQRPRIEQTVPYRDCSGCVVIELRGGAVLRDVDVSQVEGGGAVEAVAEATIERSALRGRSNALRLGASPVPAPVGGVRDVLAVAEDGVAIVVGGGGQTHQLENVTAIGRGLGTGLSVRTSATLDTTVDAVNTIARGGLYDVEAAPDGSADHDDFAVLKLRYSNFRVDRVEARPSDPAWNHAQIETHDNNQHGDPKFAGANDFHLAAGSQAIDAGRVNGLSGTRDLDGFARSFGAAPDIGAYEWRPAPKPAPGPKPGPGPDPGPGPQPGPNADPLPDPEPFSGLALAKKTATVKRGAAAIRVTCPAGPFGACAGRLKLHASRYVVGGARFSVKRGASALVRVKLNKKGRKLIARKRRLKGSATLATTNPSGEAVRDGVRITLKLAKKPNRRT